MGKESLKKFLPAAALLVSAVILTVIQPPFRLGFLGWIALVPFILVCEPGKKIAPLLILSYIISAIYWLGNVYWLEFVTIPGWIVFGFYMGLYWPLCAACLIWCRKRRLPLWLSVPVIIVGAETFQGIIFGGFNWRLLGQSQYSNITIIQIADIFGVAGVSFLVAMVNGLTAQLIIALRHRRILRTANIAAVFAVVILVTAAIFYGRFRIDQTHLFTEPGPTVAAIQPDEVITNSEESADEPACTFLDMLSQSHRALIESGAALIIWPETMVEAVLDKRFLKVSPPYFRAAIFDKALKRHASEGVYLLIGAVGGEPVEKPDRVAVRNKTNTAFLYDPNGTQSGCYSKIHLVPFGEYVPFKDVPFIYKIMRALTPYDYDYSLKKGSKYTVFGMTAAGGRKYKFSVVICYEDTVPGICSKMAYDENGRKRIDWLVNISNDGWFTRQRGDNVIPSTELAQHTAVSVFRAVENRLPIIRSVNTGISCMIDSVGRIKNGFIKGNLPQKWYKRAGKKGWFAAQITIDKRVTLFSRLRKIPEICCALLFILILIMTIYKKETKSGDLKCSKKSGKKQ